MIFPQDVTKHKETNVSFIRNVKVYLLISALVAVFAIVYIFIRPMFVAFGVPGWIIMLLTVIILGLLGFQFWRFWVFDEPSKMKDLEYNKDNQLKNIWRIAKDSKAVYRNLAYGKSMETLDYSSGQTFFVIQYKHGRVLDTDMKDNYELMLEIYRYLLENGLQVQIIVMDEPFYRDTSFDRISERISQVDNKEFGYMMVEILEFMREITRTKSNVVTEYFIVKTQTQAQRFDLGEHFDVMCYIIDKNQNSYRSINFLNEEEIYGFFKDYNNLEVLDLAVVQGLEGNEDEEERNKILIGNVVDKKGNVYEINPLPVDVKARGRLIVKDEEGEENSESTELDFHGRIWSLATEEVEVS